MKKSISFCILLLAVFVLTGFTYATDTELNVDFDSVQKTNVSDLVGSNLEENDITLQDGTDDGIMLINEDSTEDIMLINENPDEDIMLINEAENEENLINDDLYQIGEDITINQDINGNVYIMANSINMENVSILGNVFLMAKDINIKNTYISGSAYIIGQEIVLNSQIQDVYLMGETVELGNSSYISRAAKIIGETTNISGIIGTNCYISSTNINVSSEAQIEGTFSYSSSKEAQIGNSAVISEIKAKINEEQKNEETEKTTSFGIFDVLSSVVKVLVIIGVVYFISKGTIKECSKITVVDFLKTLVIGTCATIFIPIISLIALISIIGAGIGVFIILIYIILLYISSVIASYVITTNIVKDGSKKKILGLTIIVYVIYRGICIVPVVGWLVNTLMILAGVGYTIRMITNRKKEEKQEVIIEN